MQPLYAQDPLAAVERGAGWSWLDVPLAVAGGASDPWVVALLALALYSWLEQEVREVLASFLPLAAALAVAVGGVLLARQIGASPRPVGPGGPEGGSLLRLVLVGQGVAVAMTFAAYSALAYGRRAWPAPAVALAALAARAVGGAGAAELAAGAGVGLLLGASAYFGALRLLPAGHLARSRARRRAREGARPPPGA